MDSKFMTDGEILDLVAHHPPGCDHIAAAHEELRTMYGNLMVRMNNLLAEGPLKTIAIRKAHEALQAANTCVAVTQDLFNHEHR